MTQSAYRLNSHISHWQHELSLSFKNAEQLFEFLNLDNTGLPVKRLSTINFPFKITRSFASKIEKGNPNDPLLRQILPSVEELEYPTNFIENPVGDLEATAAPGLLHKYRNRVLLITTGACAINCRYCFRRNFPYIDHQLGKSDRNEAMAYITRRTEVKEVILSGGDPLLLVNSKLKELIHSLSAIKHLERLRIHTRIPTVLPSRIDVELIDILKASGLKTVIVTHINHPNEIDDKTRIAVDSFLNSGISVFNQAVLLKGVNDRLEALTKLLETAFDIGIHPYYLHMLDKAAGTAHFDVSENRCRYLEEALKRNLPGYLLPRFVREIAGEPYKVPI